MACKLTSQKKSFNQNTSLQFASDVIKIYVYLQIRLQNDATLITKRVGWIYYKLLHLLLPNFLHYYKMRRYYKMLQSPRYFRI